MNNNTFKLSVLLLVLFLFKTAPLSGQGQPIQLSLFNPLQLVSEKRSIEGFRFNLIYGKNKSMTGLDIGFINHTSTRPSLAVQFGFVGYAESDFTGWQSNLANWTSGNYKGLQWGVFNYSKSLTGVQFGFINYAVNIKKGIQIGLINVIKSGGAFPFFPLVNWSF